MKSASEMREKANTYIEEIKQREKQRIVNIVETEIMKKIEESAEIGRYYTEYRANGCAESQSIVEYLSTFGYEAEFSYGVIHIKW